MEGVMGTVHESRLTADDKSMECWAEIAEVVAADINKITTKMMAKFTAVLNECAVIPAPIALQISSGAAGISTMPPFDCTRDKAINQQWQSWSTKVRHVLDAIEGDSDKAKISYFHH